MSNNSKQHLVPNLMNFLMPLEVADLIRVGSENDGGYVVSRRSIIDSDGLLSCGVSDDWSFDLEFKRKKGGQHICIHAYDHTISQNKFFLRVFKIFVKLLLRKASFHEFTRALKLYYGYIRFFDSMDVIHFKEKIGANKTLGTTSIDTALKRMKRSKIFVKIDIEGSEYEIIEDLIANQDLIIALVIEFHDTEARREEFLSSMRSLMKYFSVIHIHGNNFAPLSSDNLPTVLELTLVKAETVKSQFRKSRFPIFNLDHPNNPLNEDYYLVFE